MAGRLTRADLDGYLPVRLRLRGGAPLVSWCWFGDARMEEPFFWQTVERMRRDPFNVVLAPETGEEALGEGAEPAGLVLHTSRCGSTLVARMLAADPESRVLSEPEPFDTALRLTALAPARRRALLRGLANAWSPASGRLFLKLDAASTIDAALVREAFPRVPRVFLYRDPAEVLASNLALGVLRAGMVPLALRAGIDLAVADDAEFGARFLARILAAAAEDEGALLVRYEELPEAFFSRILPHLGLRPPPEVASAMRAAAGIDAKNPGRRFSRDPSREVAAEVRAAAERFTREPLARLEGRRAPL